MSWVAERAGGKAVNHRGSGENIPRNLPKPQGAAAISRFCLKADEKEGGATVKVHRSFTVG